VIGGDVTSAARQLGRALEDPAAGLATLRRAGISFTEQQVAQIEAMVEQGRVAEAQGFILDQLAERVGGAAAGEASGLAGAYDRVTKSIGAMTGAIAESSGVAASMTLLLNDLAKKGSDVAKLISGPDGADAFDFSALTAAEVEQRIAAVEAERAAIEERLDSRGGLYADLLPRPAVNVRADAARFAEIDDEAEALKRARNALAAEDNQAALAAEAAKARVKALRDELERLGGRDGELAVLQRRLGELSALESTGEASREDHLNAEILRVRIEQIEAPARAALAADQAKTAAVIADLSGELTRFGDEQAQVVARALEQLPESATADDRARVEDLARQLFEKSAADRASEKLLSDLDDVRRWRERQLESYRTPDELFAEQRAGLQRALAEDLGRLRDPQDRTQALVESKAVEALARADRDAQNDINRRRDLDAKTDLSAGAQRALEDLARTAGDTADVVEGTLVSAFNGAEDALVGFVRTGKLELGDFVSAIAADFARLAIRSAVLGPIANALGQALGGVDATAVGQALGSLGTYHGGSDPLRAEDLLRLPGMAADEGVAKVRLGERVVTESQMDHVARQMARTAPTPASGARAGVQAQARQSQTADGGVRIDVEIDKHIDRYMAGPRGAAAMTRFGMRPRAGGMGA
jgi:lambda family phage tail tape measure protein